MKIDYECPSCGKVTTQSTGYSKKKRKCPECAHPITAEELARQEDLFIEALKARKNKKMLLPILLGLAALMSVIIGAFAKDWLYMYISLPLLLGLAYGVYRYTVNLI